MPLKTSNEKYVALKQLWGIKCKIKFAKLLLASFVFYSKLLLRVYLKILDEYIEGHCHLIRHSKLIFPSKNI